MVQRECALCSLFCLGWDFPVHSRHALSAARVCNADAVEKANNNISPERIFFPRPSRLSDSLPFFQCCSSLPDFCRMYFLCRTDESDFADTFEGCDVSSSTELVFFPLNNNTSVTKSGGSHWTLLVLDVPRAAIYSFDSMQGSNDRAANKLAKALAPLLPKLQSASDSSDVKKKSKEATKEARASASSSKSANVTVSFPPTPQQCNGFDCGVYTLLVAEVLARARADSKDGLPLDSDAVVQQLKESVTPKSVAQKREDIRAIIMRMAKGKK
jgi:sentrin-specific protease 8